MNSTSTRDQIVAAADKLFHQNGYANTSFAAIAEAVQISRGNFYYHFRTKDEILDAVIGRRLGHTQEMLSRWESEGKTPADRIDRFMQMLVDHRAGIQAHGCPVGTLCTELAKLDHASRKDANRLFTLFRSWLRRQFELLGRKSDADRLAMHLLALSQGVATLAHAFHDEKFIRQEVQHMRAWLAACLDETAPPG